ncbi:MAG: efflux RND transporter periplasmic adaptor subunit [Rubrivivax sp.]|nr:efflux RND transporter periplasmic adaptor subunit [Rubrivivax sp.]
MLPRLLLIALLASPGATLAADYTGLVHARHQLTLSVATAGVVAGVPVQPGRRVQAGQVLLQLDDRLQAIEEQRRKTVLDDRSELAAVEERLKLVLPLAEDARKLQASKGALSREDLARAELDVVTTRGRLLQLQAQEERERSEHQGAVQERAQRRLVAPVAGVITKVAIDLGEWARPGDPLVELVDASVLHLRVNVPAVAARSLKDGATLSVSFEPALQLPAVQGQLSFVSPVVDAASGLVELRVQFSNPGGRIPPGIKGQVKL